MRTRIGLMSAVAVLLLTVTLQVAPASADCSALPNLPEGPEDARGTTFVGTVEAYDRDARRGAVVTWLVERVYAGAPLEERLVYRSRPCHNTSVVPDVRYLFSTSDLDQPDTGDSLAWEVGADDGVTLWGFGWPTRGSYAPELLNISTLNDALSTVAPGAEEGLPATDAPSMGPISPGSPLLPLLPLLPFGIVSAAALSLLAIRAMRGRTN